MPGSADAIGKRFSRLMKKNGIEMNFHKLRHVNASVMAALRIPDKYALERGGWKTDYVMKQVYTHTFSDRRIEADTIIDSYFENALTLSQNDTFDLGKYKAWLTLFGKEDCDEARDDFRNFMQHEIQHKLANPQ